MKTEWDSGEELYFSWYIEELKDAGYIFKSEYQPQPYELSLKQTYVVKKQLKTKISEKPVTLVREHIYTPDFEITWNKKARGVFFQTTNSGVSLKDIPFVAHSSGKRYFSIIEIKPEFDHKNMTRLFEINKKWVLQKAGIYVNKIVVVKPSGGGLFQTTFCPERYLLTDKSMKARRLNFQPEGIKDFINKNLSY